MVGTTGVGMILLCMVGDGIIAGIQVGILGVMVTIHIGIQAFMAVFTVVGLTTLGDMAIMAILIVIMVITITEITEIMVTITDAMYLTARAEEVATTVVIQEA